MPDNAPLMPLPDITGLDDLLDRARVGVQAGNALDVIRHDLASARDKKYRELLNSTDAERLLALKYELKAIEALAQSLLVKEVQGEVAYNELMARAGAGTSAPEIAVLKPERVNPRKRSSRSKRAAAK